MRKATVTVLLVAAVLLPVVVRSEKIAAPADLLIIGVSVVEPSSDRVLGPRDILVDNGFIVEVTDGGTISPDRAAKVLSARDLFALPGLSVSS